MTTLPPQVARDQLLHGLAVMVEGLAAAGKSDQEIIGYIAPNLARSGLLTRRDVRELAALVSELAPSPEGGTEQSAEQSSADELRRSVARVEVQLDAMRRATAALETLADTLE